MGNAAVRPVGGLLATPFDPSGRRAGAGNAGGIIGVSGKPRRPTTPAARSRAAWRYDRHRHSATRRHHAQLRRGQFSADRQRVEDSLMARMNPQLQSERASIEQRLADQGIRYGSQAYTSAMDDYNRQANDARFAAIGQAGQEQQRMMDMAAKGGFRTPRSSRLTSRRKGAAVR